MRRAKLICSAACAPGCAPAGFLTFAVGLGLLVAADRSFLKKVGSAIRGGVMLLIASIALYAAAASRRRRAYRTFE
jgi:hypothetical protein